MGVSEDVESPLHEEEALFERNASKAKKPAAWRGSGRFACFGPSVVGLLLALAMLAACSPGSLAMLPGLALSRGGEPAPCGPSGTCEMWSLLFDPEVHETVANNLVQAATPTLSNVDIPMVRGIVVGGFRNMSAALEAHAPKVAREMRLLRINSTVKQYMAEAMQLVTDPRVQRFGRRVAAAARASQKNARGEEELKQQLVKNLWHDLDEFQHFELQEIKWRTLSLWSLGKSSHWQMTLDAVAMDWLEVASADAASARPAMAANIDAGLTAIAGGALAEGRTLLDLMLMCVSSKGPSWDVDLHGAVRAFSGPLASACDPELPAGAGLDFSLALTCPLKFGMLGVDALRFASGLRRKPEEAGCERPGLCPLRGLFFDEEVHKMVAKGLVGLGVPLLGSVEMEEVAGLVGRSFRNVSAALQRHAPRLGDELNQLSVNKTVRGLLLQAVSLTRDPQVKNVGRFVARAMAAGRPYENGMKLRRHLAKSLEPELASVQKLQEEIIPWALREIWSWGEERQWDLALAVNKAEVFGASLNNPALLGISERDAAIAGGALEEGRALLDVMLMCISSKGPSWGAALGDAERIFEGPLSGHCETEGVSEAEDFRSVVICPLKLGLLGLDALRFAQHASQSKEHQACKGPQACYLRDVFSDRFVQERVVADIIGAAADPSMIMGRSELPMVRRAVVSAFGNISAALHSKAPWAEEALVKIAMNESVKQYIFEALQLLTDLHVQEIGRHVARALRSVSKGFEGVAELKAEVVKNLWMNFKELERLQETVKLYAVRSVWRSSASPQLELSYELEVQERMHLASKEVTSKALLAQEDALGQAAWQEGRALLDVALSFVHSGLKGAVGGLPPPPHVHCDPDVKLGQEAGFRSSLVCPLRFGIMGMDVLRFTDSLFAWHGVEHSSCRDRGLCPLSRLFFDDYVHAAATADILRVAGDRVGAEKVEGMVGLAFRNVSVHVHLYATGVAENLLALQANEWEKEQYIEEMQLAADPVIQAFGREVAAAMRATAGFSSPAELKVQIVGFLGARRLEGMRNYSLTWVDERVRKTWTWSEAEQWTMAADAETINAMKMAPPPPAQAPETAAERAEVLRQAALLEGRILLDALLMRIRRLPSKLSTSLYGAMDVFAPALAVACRLEPEASPESLREALLCPLKFGALGIDGLRYASTAVHV